MGFGAIFDFGIPVCRKVKAADVPEAALKTKDYIQEYRAFLKLLKRARQESGLTQTEVARLLRRPQSFVSKSESGERRVDYVELRHFARIYKKPLSFFDR